MKSDPFIQPYTEVNSDIPGEDQILDGSVKDSEKTLPLRALLTRPVVISVANYGVIGLLGIITEAVIPLVWSTSVRFGGLGMSPASIGLWMAGYGTMSGVVQLAAFPSIVRRFGPRNVFIASIFSFFPIYLMFPFQNLALRHSSRGLYPTTGLLILLQLSAILVVEMGFGKFFITYQLHRARSLKWCVSISCDIDVHILCGAQQAVSRRYEWNSANDGLDSALSRTSSCRVTVCFLAGKKYLGRKLCVSRAARDGGHWDGRRSAASKEHVGPLSTVNL